MYKSTDFKLKLIFPCKFETPYTVSIYYLPYGMGVLTAFLRQHNYYVEQADLSVKFNRRMKGIDLDIDRNKGEIRRFLKSDEKGGKLALLVDKVLDSTSIEGFNAIGFSIISIYHFLFALLLSKKIKQITTTPIIFGGPFITLYGHLYPEVSNFIDYMIVGDGRVPLLKLIDYLNNKITISEVPNLIYRENGKLITNPKENYSIEDIPIPDFSDLPLKLYENRYSDFSRYDILFPYQISRGCISRCSFCTNPDVNCKLEFKSYDKVIRELSQMKKRYNSKVFHFCDDEINNSYGYLEGLCALFIKHRLNINWRAYAKVGNLDKHILRKMKEAGCIALHPGIESGSDRILKSMHKGFTTEQVARTIKDATETGLEVCVCLIIGYLHETQEDIQQTIEFIRKNRKYITLVYVHKFELLHGSLIYSNPERCGITNLTPNSPHFSFTFDESGGLKWEEKQKQQEHSQEEIERAVYKYIKHRCSSIIRFIFHFIFSVLNLQN